LEIVDVLLQSVVAEHQPLHVLEVLSVLDHILQVGLVPLHVLNLSLEGLQLVLLHMQLLLPALGLLVLVADLLFLLFQLFLLLLPLLRGVVDQRGFLINRLPHLRLAILKQTELELDLLRALLRLNPLRLELIISLAKLLLLLQQLRRLTDLVVLVNLLPHLLVDLLTHSSLRLPKAVNVLVLHLLKELLLLLLVAFVLVLNDHLNY
jgi:hypothetical protein